MCVVECVVLSSVRHCKIYVSVQAGCLNSRQPVVLYRWQTELETKYSTKGRVQNKKAENIMNLALKGEF